MLGLLIVLVLANVATLLILWQNRHPKHPGMHPDEPKNVIIKDLNLNNEQIKQYEMLIADHRKAMNDIRKTLAHQKEQLFDLVAAPDATDSTINHFARACATSYEQMDVVTIKHFKQLRAICTLKQQEKLDHTIRNVAKMMNEHQAPPKHR